MTADTAVCVLLSVAGFVFSTKPTTARLRLAAAAAAVLFILSLLALVQYAENFSTWYDIWLPYNYHAQYMGRPAPQTAAGFLLIAAGLLAANPSQRGWPLLADVSAVLLVGFVLVLFGGRLYGALDLLGINPATMVSPQTLLTFALLAFTAVARRARQGKLLAVLINVGLGSHLIRRILPLAMTMPFLFFAALAYTIQSHLLPAPYARAIATTTAVFLIICIASWMGDRINALERGLRDLSLTDELTNIYNRRGFYFLGQQAVREAARTQAGMTVLFFDLNRLKHVNDQLGHAAGSLMLQKFAAILVQTFRNSDIIGRLGGDEFCVLTIHDNGVPVGELIARLNLSVAGYNAEQPQNLPLAFSVGHAVMDYGSTESIEDLVTRADGLMYLDKAQSKQALLF